MNNNNVVQINNTKPLTLKFNDKAFEVRTHPTIPGLFKLNDIHKASGQAGNVKDRTKSLSEKSSRRFSIVPINGGPYRGTYGNQKACDWLIKKLEDSRKAPNMLYIIGCDAEAYDQYISPKHNRGMASFYYKIGITSNPKARLQTLQGGCPIPLKIHGKVTLDDAKEYEQWLHKTLKHTQSTVSQEWFILTFHIRGAECLGGYSVDTVYPETVIKKILEGDREYIKRIASEDIEIMQDDAKA